MDREIHQVPSQDRSVMGFIYLYQGFQGFFGRSHFKPLISWTHIGIHRCEIFVCEKMFLVEVQSTKQRMVFGMIHVKDSLLPMGKV